MTSRGAVAAPPAHAASFHPPFGFHASQRLALPSAGRGCERSRPSPSSLCFYSYLCMVPSEGSARRVKRATSKRSAGNLEEERKGWDIIQLALRCWWWKVWVAPTGGESSGSLTEADGESFESVTDPLPVWLLSFPETCKSTKQRPRGMVTLLNLQVNHVHIRPLLRSHQTTFSHRQLPWNSLGDGGHFCNEGNFQKGQTWFLSFFF